MRLDHTTSVPISLRLLYKPFNTPRVFSIPANRNIDQPYIQTVAMTDPKEVEPIKEQEAEKVEDEKKSETEDKEKTEDKVREAEETEKAGDDKMETDDVEKGGDDKKEEEPKKEEDAAAAKAKTTKKRKKDEVAKTAPEEGDDKEDIETAAGTDGRTKREKRVRKSADVFEPDNFLGKDKSLQVVAGRGTKLAEIDAVKATIDKLSMNSADLMLAHRLLYTRQGKPAKKEIKKNLLEFCGFLPLAEEGQDKKELEALEEEAEVRIEYSGSGSWWIRVPACQSGRSLSRCLHFILFLLIYRPK
jgi:outer membrane biosynthesis protein TonB